jgi:hypothetical protein
MKEVKTKIRDFMSSAWGEIEYGLRTLCGKPSPVKRLITVLIISGALTVIYLYFIVSSVCRIKQPDVKDDFLHLQHIESLEWRQRQDSIRSVEREKAP